MSIKIQPQIPLQYEFDSNAIEFLERVYKACREGNSQAVETLVFDPSEFYVPQSDGDDANEDLIAFCMDTEPKLISKYEEIAIGIVLSCHVTDGLTKNPERHYGLYEFFLTWSETGFLLEGIRAIEGDHEDDWFEREERCFLHIADTGAVASNDALSTIKAGKCRTITRDLAQLAIINN